MVLFGGDGVHIGIGGAGVGVGSSRGSEGAPRSCDDAADSASSNLSHLKSGMKPPAAMIPINSQAQRAMKRGGACIGAFPFDEVTGDASRVQRSALVNTVGTYHL